MLSADPLNSCSLILNSAQDNLHDLLSSTNPTEFPRHGPNGTSIENIFSTLFINESYKITLEYKCPHTTLCSVSNLMRTSHQLPSLLTALINQWMIKDPTVSTSTIQDWVDESLGNAIQKAPLLTCSNPCNGIQNPCPFVLYLPPIITFEIGPDIEIDIIHSTSIHIPGNNKLHQYSLTCNTYYGGYHFTAWMINVNNNIWSYGGQLNKGVPWQESHCFDFTNENHRKKLMDFQDWSIHFLIFTILVMIWDIWNNMCHIIITSAD